MSRKTQYGWMAVGAMLCLIGIGFALKLRDTNRAVAQDTRGYFLPDQPTAPVTKNDAKALAETSPKPIPAPPIEPPSPVALQTPAEPSVPTPPPPPPVTNTIPEVKLQTPALPPNSVPLPPVTAETPVIPPPPPVAAVPPPLPEPNVPPLTPVPEATPKVEANGANPRAIEPIPAPSVIVPVSAMTKNESRPGEPPLAAVVGPLQTYEVPVGGETIQEVARKTLGTSERWQEIKKLNPSLAIKAGEGLAPGTLVRLPAEACVSTADEIEAIKPLPAMRPKSVPAVAKKVLPLTGTFPCTIDEKHMLTLPKGLRDQLGSCDTILVSPGPDQCLWITNQAHLERLAEHLEQSPAKEMDVRVFKRLYYAQTEKATLTPEGTTTFSDKLVQFAGLRQDVVLVGIDEHFELWDAARWRAYTQQKSAEARAAMAEHD